MQADVPSSEPDNSGAPWRTGLASVVIVCFLVLVVGAAMPESKTSAEVERLLGPTVLLAGFQQGWGVFSPNPSQIDVRTHAIVYFQDGTSQVWEPPTRGRFDSSRSERWRKWEARVRLDSHEAYWPTTAQFVADEFVARPSQVARVRLVRTWSDVPLPPKPNHDREVLDFHFYEWNPLTSVGKVLTRADQLSVEPQP